MNTNPVRITKSGRARAKDYRAGHRNIPVELSMVDLVDQMRPMIAIQLGKKSASRPEVVEALIQDGAKKHLMKAGVARNPQSPVTNPIPPAPTDDTGNGNAPKEILVSPASLSTLPTLETPQLFAGGEIWAGTGLSVIVKFDDVDPRRHWLHSRGYSYDGAKWTHPGDGHDETARLDEIGIILAYLTGQAVERMSNGILHIAAPTTQPAVQ